jgi:hypothetical protein
VTTEGWEIGEEKMTEGAAVVTTELRDDRKTKSQTA